MGTGHKPGQWNIILGLLLKKLGKRHSFSTGFAKLEYPSGIPKLYHTHKTYWVCGPPQERGAGVRSREVVERNIWWHLESSWIQRCLQLTVSDFAVIWGNSFPFLPELVCVVFTFLANKWVLTNKPRVEAENGSRKWLENLVKDING